MNEILLLIATFLGITKEQLLVLIIGWATIIILIKLIIREFKTYYWKINERIENQEKIIELLKDMNQMQEYQRNFLKYIYKEHKETNRILRKLAQEEETEETKQENT